MIRTQSLSVHYGPVTAIDGVTLEVPMGEVTAVVGPSGCGKSSYLAALNRMTDLIPGAKVTGQAWLGEREIHGPDLHPIELRRRVGCLFQKPNPFPMSIRRNIQLALREQGQRDRSQLEAITERVLQEVGLWDEVSDRLHQSALQLSGGQQQRLCLARALALEPDVLLMDEPCSALDPLATARIEELIQRLRGRYTVLIVTHNLAQARRIADRMAVFWFQDGAGRMIEEGLTQRLFEDPQNTTAAAYLSGVTG